MGLKQRLSDLFWPPDEPGSEPQPRAELRGKPAGAVTAKPGPKAAAAPVEEAPAPAPRPRVVAPIPDPKGEARRAAAYERVAASCPVPIHPEDLPLPGGLRLLEDEFLVAASSRAVRGHQVTLTTQRLLYTRGADARAQLVVYLSDICDVVFHDDATATVGTPSGRWERLVVSGNNLAASRHGLLELVHHARNQRSALPGGLDELVEMRDRGAIGSAEYEQRRATRRRRQPRQVEVAGRATGRRETVATDDAASAAPAETPDQPAEGGR